MRRIRSDPRWRALLIAILTIGVGGWVASTPYLLHGLTRHYYDNAEWAGQPATTVRDRTLRLEGSDFPWYGSWYSVEWTGVLYIATGDIYHFALTSDDGAGLWIDDIQVIDNDAMPAAATAEGSANLARGFRRIRVRYVQYDDEVAFSASWRPSGGGAEADAPLATAMLFPRAPSLAMFGVYRVGRGLAAAGTMALLVALVVLPVGWGVWALAGRRSRHQWSATVGRTARQWTVRAVLVLGSLGVALVGAEITLRAVYRDNGRTTSGGPGGAKFAYTLPRWSTDYRIGGPNADAARAPGTTRVLIQGDSITWGQGVADGTLLYPSRLLAKLREVGSYYMTVQAEPGRAIDEHVILLDRAVERLEPDVIIYQWFVNDIVRYEWFRRYQELGGRPSFEKGWSRWRYHEAAREHSFLYWLLYRRVSEIAANRSYADYARHVAQDGSRLWQHFRTQFHRWATRATANAGHVILLEYPVLPFRGEYPLSDLHQRLAAAAGASVWSQPAFAADGRVGTNKPAVESRYGAVRRGDPGVRGELVAFRDLPFRRGQYEVTFYLRLMDQATGIVGRVEIGRGDQRLAERSIRAVDFAALGEWQAFTARFGIEERLVEDVSLRVMTEGRGRIEVDTVDLPTDYGIEVVDPMPDLQDFDTWASPFDAHPNAKAHAVLADTLYERLTSTR